MSRRLAILGCAIALVLVDLPKPLVIDDAAYYAFARHIAEHPGDPYGFEIFWYNVPQPANQVLAPPVFLYWLAAGLRLLGDHPPLWKLWMFPFALLLTSALAALLRRLAPRVATPLLCAIALSPPILPALNLMLDIPSQALALCALALALRACDADRAGLALLAGLVAGLALETKYTALMPLLAALVYALQLRRPRLAIAIGAGASAVFVGWELLMFHAYGASHFVEGLHQVSRMEAPSHLHWVGAAFGLLGSSALGLGVLALAALGAGRGPVVAAMGVATAGLLGVAALPGAPLGGGLELFPGWRSELWIYLPLGLCVLGALGALVWRQVRDLRDAADPERARHDRFVLLWVAIEVAGFFLVSPYPALRRLIGLAIACSFLVARALDRGSARVPLRPLVAWGAAIGLLFAVSDITDARVRHDVLARAIARLDADPSIAAGATRWYVGHWGFQFQAERAGLRPVVPGRTRLAPGDVVVLPSGVFQQPFRVPASKLVKIDTLSGANPWPWSTLPWAYSGYPPLRPQPDVQITVHLGRVIAPAEAR